MGSAHKHQHVCPVLFLKPNHFSMCKPLVIVFDCPLSTF